VGPALLVQTFLSAPTRDLLFPEVALLGLEVELRDYFREGWVLGGDFAVGTSAGTLALAGGTFDYEFSQGVAGLTLAYEPWPDARVRPRVGGRLAYVSMERTFPGNDALPAQRLATVAPGLVAGVAWDALPPVSLFARARASYLVYRAEDDRSLGFLDLGAGVQVEF
jgi:hypothetical protein